MATTTTVESSEMRQYDRAESWAGVTWTHETTGLRVEASRVSRPTQMHNPTTATNEEFWRVVARLNDEFEVVAERIPAGSNGRAQSGEETAVERAREWIASHSDGKL